MSNKVCRRARKWRESIVVVVDVISFVLDSTLWLLRCRDLGGFAILLNFVSVDC